MKRPIESLVIETILLITLATIIILWLAGCQWSSYNTETFSPITKQRIKKTGIGTIEFMVIDSKQGLKVTLEDGTQIVLGSTLTDPDEKAIEAVGQQIIDQLKTLLME